MYLSKLVESLELIIHRVALTETRGSFDCYLKINFRRRTLPGCIGPGSLLPTNGQRRLPRQGPDRPLHPRDRRRRLLCRPNLLHKSA